MSPRKKPLRTEGEPHDRVTRLANEVLQSLEDHPEYKKGVKAICFIQDHGRGGIGIHGYSDDRDAVVDLIIHLKAMIESMGKTLEIHPITPNDPGLS